MHILATTATSLDDIVEAGRSRPVAGRNRDSVVRRQRPHRARGRLGGRTRRSAERAARTFARPSPSDVGRSVDRARRRARQSHRRAPARRPRLVEIRNRTALGAGARPRHRARGVAGRRPGRRAPCGGLDPAGDRAAKRCCNISAKADRTICAACYGGLPVILAPRCKPQRPGQYRAMPVIFPDKALSISTASPPRLGPARR